ncbi:hypothetical protein QR98_0071360 [Sarcoptes scabiei]|uniref:Uncharacterized protein n=1 Tax=Sarcoptes scabiei TaxID=52283 RepID=A0A132AC99_SARSC|nr:hypothetical protein QR98_0071360 [Sarcoptes scabiei]
MIECQSKHIHERKKFSIIIIIVVVVVVVLIHFENGENFVVFRFEYRFIEEGERIEEGKPANQEL